MSTPDPAASSRLPTVDAAPRVGEDAFVVPRTPLAKGGMAEIYLAEDRRLPRDVILKRPRRDAHLAAEDIATFEARLEAEALVLARLQHPAIVTLYEVGRDRGGLPFCVLERVQGKSLRARLDKLAEEEAAEGTPRTGERLELLAGLVAIVEALAYAHERGIVHRDVTPGNVLLGARGEMTLIDWGLAKDTHLATIEAGITRALDGALGEGGGEMTIGAGTPPYVCFAQTQGEKADPSYDVYSLGVVMYEVIAGRTPYKFEMPADQAGREQAVQSFLRWARSGPEVEPAAPRDAELSGIIARAMAREADERFTADELARALRQYLTGELVFSHRYSLSGRLGRWVRRHRALSVSFALAAIAVVGAALSWSAMRTSDAERARERARDEAVVLAQGVEAAEAQTRAADAETRAADAERAADQARRDGKDARALQTEAERLRRTAQSQAARAKEAAQEATTAAGEAEAQWRAARAERDAALSAKETADAARADAEKARADAEKARVAAEQARATALAARDQAEDERDAAAAARVQAESQRDTAQQARAAAEQARGQAETERDAAAAARSTSEAARSAAEKDRDAAQARVRALEAKVRELEQGGGSGGGGGGGGRG